MAYEHETSRDQLLHSLKHVKTIPVKSPENTLLKTNMSPKKGDDSNRTYMDFQGKNRSFLGRVFQLPTINFQVLLLLVSGTVSPMGHLKMLHYKKSANVSWWKCTVD